MKRRQQETIVKDLARKMVFITGTSFTHKMKGSLVPTLQVSEPARLRLWEPLKPLQRL